MRSDNYIILTKVAYKIWEDVLDKVEISIMNRVKVKVEKGLGDSFGNTLGQNIWDDVGGSHRRRSATN